MPKWLEFRRVLFRSVGKVLAAHLGERRAHLADREFGTLELGEIGRASCRERGEQGEGEARLTRDGGSSERERGVDGADIGEQATLPHAAVHSGSLSR